MRWVGDHDEVGDRSVHIAGRQRDGKAGVLGVGQRLAEGNRGVVDVGDRDTDHAGSLLGAIVDCEVKTVRTVVVGVWFVAYRAGVGVQRA